jgi:DNA-binding response OmpR family regulator
MEFDLLLTLIKHSDRVVSRSELLEAVWRRTRTGTTRTVDKHVSALRRKLCRNTRRSLIIVTEPQKAGYRLFIDAAGTS